MAAETAATREKTRRVKNHILDRYLKLADKVEQEGGKDNLNPTELTEYERRSDQFAVNCVPRTQEITGEDGQAISITFDKAFKLDGTSSETETGSSEPSEV